MFCWFRHVRASVFAVPAFLAAINPAFAAPGDLDAAGFGAGTGKILTAIGPAYDRAAGIALQPDGKIIVAGPCRNDNNDDFCVARYLPGGALDTSFNGTGTALAAIGASDDIATAVALQPDGKVVVAGYCFNGGRYDFCVSRHLTTGAIDTSFDGTGRVMTTIGTAYSMALTLMLQPDGKIVVAGVCSNGGNNDFCLARYLTSGALDTSFNGTGKVLTPIGLSDDTANAIALQSDGRIVVAGFCLGGGADFCLARYMTDGTLDTTFGSTGKTFTSFGASDDNVYSIALQPDGKIVVAGECRSGGSADFCLARYQRDGALDPSFNGTGKLKSAIGAGDDVASALALQPDGKIVVAGLCHNGSNYDFCLARYLASGVLDTSFGSAGTTITPVGTSQDHGRALALQPDGKIVVAGACNNGSRTDFCLTRHEGGPFDARNCSMDIDGDNRVLATTDSLIHARIALGMTGPAVIDGITFASHAARQTWADIRNYLVTQCGMSLVQ